MDENQLKQRYIEERGCRKAYGFAINTMEMNPEEYEEIIFEGKTLNDAIKDFFREVVYWVYEPSSEEQVFEDVNEALDYVEEISDVSYEKYKEINQ